MNTTHDGNLELIYNDYLELAEKMRVLISIGGENNREKIEKCHTNMVRKEIIFMTVFTYNYPFPEIENMKKRKSFNKFQYNMAKNIYYGYYNPELYLRIANNEYIYSSELDSVKLFHYNYETMKQVSDCDDSDIKKILALLKLCYGSLKEYCIIDYILKKIELLLIHRI